jgi:hypothetical protein
MLGVQARHVEALGVTSRRSARAQRPGHVEALGATSRRSARARRPGPSHRGARRHVEALGSSNRSDSFRHNQY